MNAHIIDSKILGDFFGTREKKRIYSDKNMIQKWLDVEASLAKVQAELHIIPEAAAEEIQEKANVENLDMEKLREDIMFTTHPIVPVINQLDKVCENGHGQYIHWGATTQDIMDTGAILQMKEAIHIIESEMEEVMDHLLNLAKEHKGTVMIGRTHGQQALPITFGYKVAIWLEEVNRHFERLNEMKSRVLRGQFSGAVGTLASLGDKGLTIQEKLMIELGLYTGLTAWHNSRDGLAEIATFMGMLTGTMGKIAKEIVNLQKTEFSELEEPFNMGKVGSSTMPHKKNPMLSESVVSLSRIVRTNSNLLLEGMVHEHERDMVAWMVEWEVIPELFLVSSANLATMNVVLKDLKVNEDNMYNNVLITKGLIASETVMLALGEKIGRQRSHDLIYKIAMEAQEQNKDFSSSLIENEEVRVYLKTEDIERLLEPKASIGLSENMTDRVIQNIKELNNSLL